MKSSRRNPVVVLAEAATLPSQLSIKLAGPICHGLRECKFAQPPQKETHRLFVTPAGKLSDADC